MQMMRRITTAVAMVGLIFGLLTGSVGAGEKGWTPEINSPPDPAQVVSDWGTPAQGEVPSRPWSGGYPYDRVPDQSFTGLK